MSRAACACLCGEVAWLLGVGVRVGGVFLCQKPGVGRWKTKTLLVKDPTKPKLNKKADKN